MTEPTSQATALRERLLALRRDIGTVITVASRRSDPDADHKAMLIRLREWEKELWEAALAQAEPRTDAPRAETQIPLGDAFPAFTADAEDDRMLRRLAQLIGSRELMYREPDGDLVLPFTAGDRKRLARVLNARAERSKQP